MTHYATLVFSAPTEEALEAAVRPLWDLVPFSSDKSKARLTAASWSRDAMSILDAVEALVNCWSLDRFDRDDCIKEILTLNTWDECLAKFAEWDLDLRDGELVDLREEAA